MGTRLGYPKHMGTSLGHPKPHGYKSRTPRPHGHKSRASITRIIPSTPSQLYKYCTVSRFIAPHPLLLHNYTQVAGNIQLIFNHKHLWRLSTIMTVYKHYIKEWNKWVMGTESGIWGSNRNGLVNPKDQLSYDKGAIPILHLLPHAQS